VSPPGQADHNSSMMRMMPDGARIACRRQGDGPGTVLVHGGFIDSRSWTGLMEVLGRTRTVVAADRRGHGDSDPYASSYRLSDDIGDLVAIATDLAAEAGEAELVAVSAGCHVALAAAVAGAPAARVVLWEPPDFRATPVSAGLYDRLDQAAASGDRKLLVRLLLNEIVGVNTGSRVPRPVFPLLFRSPFGQMALANALAIPTGMRAFEAYDWDAQDLSTLDMPVTFLIGSKSPPFNRRFADSIVSRIPHATIEVIDGGSHGTPMEQPDRFAQVLDQLRTRRTQPRSTGQA
jgi:pimeloyl-ACP methyl ester carboxylesterase